MISEKRFNPEKADMLMGLERKKRLPPNKIVGLLNIEPDDAVADLGAGNGYFAIPMAKQSENTVYAVDIEPKMLEMLKENARKEQVENIKYVKSDLDHIQLDDQSVSKVMISLVMHEVPDINRTLREIKRILKPGGMVLIIEWKAVETESGPPVYIRISSEEMVRLLEKKGFVTEVISFYSEYYGVKAAID